MNTAFLCLGGNLGNRLENLKSAISILSEEVGTVAKQSNIYETEAWGSKSKKAYLNQCICLKTKLEPKELLNKLLAIEQKLGRKRTAHQNSDRTIDIDIIQFNKLILNTDALQLPHPRYHLRKFVLIPLNEIAPQLKHPILKTSTASLLKSVKDELTVTKFKTRQAKIICFEGNIGSGKTTTAMQLAKKLKADYVAEEFESTPLLERFYTNQKKYAFALESHFLMSRFNTLLSAYSQPKKTLVCDYSFYKSLWFAKTTLKGKQLKHFEDLFHTLSGLLPEPDLIIYLTTSNDTLKANIEKRGRSYEANINTDYLKRIEKSYTKGLKKIKHIKQITVEISDYSNSAKILRNILNALK